MGAKRRGGVSSGWSDAGGCGAAGGGRIMKNGASGGRLNGRRVEKVGVLGDGRKEVRAATLAAEAGWMGVGEGIATGTIGGPRGDGGQPSTDKLLGKKLLKNPPPVM